MLIALTGLHAAGKSYFANNIPTKFGFKVYNKKEIVRYICEEENGGQDSTQWYREQFKNNPYEITKKILSYIDENEDIILDAVHSDLEWNIISSIRIDAEIVAIITPEFIRNKRREDGDEQKDIQRIGHWHNGGGCLMTKISWSFNGGAPLEINEKMFEEFINYIKKKELAIKENNVEFSHSKVERIEQLIKENDELDKKIEYGNNMIEEYKKKMLDIKEECCERKDR